MTPEDRLLLAMKNRLFIFDMDGTLLVQTTACLEIAKATGTLHQLHVLEASFSDGQIDAFRFAQEIASLWGILDKQCIRKAFEATPKLKNIVSVTSLINRGGGKSCLITMSPNVYADHFYEFGFDFIEASGFPECPESEVTQEQILTPQDKVVIAKRICDELGFELKNCVAFGDSMSDYFLFKELQHTVSVNGDPTLRGLARYQYHGTDLHDALLLVCREILPQ
jgi:phosphoserine phosphatase